MEKGRSMADLKYLNRLAKDYPNIMAASAEIINLKAIMALPKGTEYFLSDLHGEHESFIHMLKSASGTSKAKIDEHYGSVRSEKDRDDLAALIYNAEAELARRKKSESVSQKRRIFMKNNFWEQVCILITLPGKNEM